MTEKTTYKKLEKRIQELEQAEFDQKQAEEALQKSEAKYKALFDNMNSGVAVYKARNDGEDFIFLDFNKTGEKIDCVQKKDLIGKSVLEIFPGIKDFSLFNVFQRVWKTGQPEHHPITLYKDERLTGWRNNFVYKLPSGEVVAVYSDETDSKRKEEALRKSQERLKDFINSATDSFVFFDSELNIIKVNKAHMEMFHPGMDQKDLIGKNLLEIVPNLKETGRFDDFMKVIKTGIPFYSDDIVPHQKFGNRLLSVKAFKMNAGLGTITVDVTRQKRTERALFESEKKFRELVEDVTEVIYSVDDKGIVNYISPAVRRSLGYEPKDIIGRAFLDFIHPEDHLRLLEKFQKVLSGQSGSSEYRVLSKTGEYRWIRSSSKPIYDNSRPVGLRGIFSDITEERRLRADFQQTQKMEAIGTLAGGIAHEFNNILAIILGNTELAIDDVPEWNPAKYCLEEIRTASLRAKGVVRQILSFARKIPTTRKPIKISAIIKESLKLIRVTIPMNIQIHQEILCDSEMILADPTEIIQILMNLCSNSTHAMEEETGILEVRLETTILNDRSSAQYEGLTAGAYVKLTVKDTGKGIDPEIINRIFDPYFTTKDVDKGSGMGLAVVIGIVKQHDGAIKFMSEVGKGTTAEVLFPVTGVQAETEAEESDDLPSGTERILFVDDEASLVKITKQMLERQGYEVVGKTTSTEALELFQEESDKFDLIISDMAMPDMPGDRLAQEIIKIRPSIPIILCTGHSDRIDEEKAKDLGIRAYAMKPLDKKGLTKMVRKILDEAKGKTQG